MLPRVSATRVPEKGVSDILSSLEALPGCSGDLKVFLFLLTMVKKGAKEVEKVKR